MKPVALRVQFALAAVAIVGPATTRVPAQPAGSTTSTVPEAWALRQRAEEFTRLKAVARDVGLAHVIVELDVPGLGALSAASRRARVPATASQTDAKLTEAIAAVTQGELAKLQGVRHTVNRTYKTVPFIALTVSETALEILEESSGIVGINEDVPKAPSLDNTVGIVGGTNAWDLGFDGSGWYVAILDTGIRDTHEFFAGKDIVQACFALGQDGASGAGDCPNGLSTDTSSPNAAEHHATPPSSGHGTHVAGIAVGNGPGVPSAGVAKGADIIAIQVFSQYVNSSRCDPPGSSCVLTWPSDYVAALEHVYSLRGTYDIASVNMSLGGGPPNGYFNQTICDGQNASAKAAIDSLRSAGIATLASAGNDYYCNGIDGPACISSAIAVGATNDSDNEAGFSNFQSDLLDIYAPGVDIRSSLQGSDSSYGRLSGTSMAAPHVAGAWAILRQADPVAGVQTIFDALQATGATVNGDCVGTPTQRRIQIDAVLHEFLGSVVTCEVNKLVASDLESGAQFGHAVAVDGEVAVIGARGDPCGADLQCGSAYVYRWSQSAWIEEDKLVASDADAEDLFGGSVAVSGDVVVAGARFDDHEGGTDAGSAYVYEWDGDAWSGEQKLIAPDAEANDQFGSPVAVQADVVLVGARNEGNTGGSDGLGAVYVFRNNGTSWVFEVKLTASDAAVGDWFGGTVSIDGGVVALGAARADCGAGSDCGAAYVFRWNGSSWVEEQKLTASDPVAGDRLGSSVSIDGTLVLTGAWLADCDAGSDCGAAYIYGWDGASWAEEAKLTGQAASDWFGLSVSIHSEIGLVGARSADCIDGNDCGAAYVVRQIEGNWVLDGKLTAADAAAGDTYGSGVALGERAALVGARLHDPVGVNDAGAAYAYAFPADCNDSGIADTCDILGGTSADTDPPDGVPDECICLESSPPEPQRLSLPGDPISQKIRYLSFSAGDTGASQAIRMTFADLPTAYDAWDGVAMWVAEPATFCENAGKTTPPCPPAQPSNEFTAATLRCEPYYMDWSVIGYFHVYHEGIIPAGRYQIQAIDESCDISLEEDYSAPLELTTSRWGDLVNNCTTCPCGPPDGTVGIPTDVTAALDKFKNLEPPGFPCAAVTKARADLDWETPNRRVDISDVTFSLDAFRGAQYPPESFSDPPTEDPCPGP